MAEKDDRTGGKDYRQNNKRAGKKKKKKKKEGEKVESNDSPEIPNRG